MTTSSEKSGTAKIEFKTQLSNMKTTYRSIMEVTNYVITSEIDPLKMAKYWLQLVKNEKKIDKKKAYVYLVSELFQFARKKKDQMMKKPFQGAFYNSLIYLKGSIDSTCLKCLGEELYISIFIYYRLIY